MKLDDMGLPFLAGALGAPLVYLAVILIEGNPVHSQPIDHLALLFPLVGAYFFSLVITGPCLVLVILAAQRLLNFKEAPWWMIAICPVMLSAIALVFKGIEFGALVFLMGMANCLFILILLEVRNRNSTS